MTLRGCRDWMLGAALGLLLIGGCTGEPATAEACREIFDRIVELELYEQSFRDPALALRKRSELRVAFAVELRRCEGRRLAAGALGCVRSATTTEQVSHACLR